MQPAYALDLIKSIQPDTHGIISRGESSSGKKKTPGTIKHPVLSGGEKLYGLARRRVPQINSLRVVQIE
jgi:hypothetical protein